jgi:hypothetical protein
MPRLFGRSAALTVGIGSSQALRFTEVDFAFTIQKTLDRSPNTAEIRIFNLSQQSRTQIEETEIQQIQLEAGYQTEGGLSTIFVGDKRKASSMRSGVDIITTIEGADGERAARQRRINRSFGPGTLLDSVIETVAGVMGGEGGIGLGNLTELTRNSLDFEGNGAEFPEGTVVSGNAMDILRGLVTAAGAELSVQDQNFQILRRGQNLPEQAVVLRSDTGLIESPSVDSEGVVSARALLIPGIFPGRQVQLLSEFVSGFFRVQKATYTGDTSVGANEWFVDIEAKAAT